MASTDGEPAPHVSKPKAKAAASEQPLKKKRKTAHTESNDQGAALVGVGKSLAEAKSPSHDDPARKLPPATAGDKATRSKRAKDKVAAPQTSHKSQAAAKVAKPNRTSKSRPNAELQA